MFDGVGVGGGLGGSVVDGGGGMIVEIVVKSSHLT